MLKTYLVKFSKLTSVLSLQARNRNEAIFNARMWAKRNMPYGFRKITACSELKNLNGRILYGVIFDE